MKSVHKFLKDCGVFFLATEEGDQARVRPFGAMCIYNDRLYFVTANIKPVFAQMKKNPKVEICGSMNGEWVRVTAEAVFDTTKETKAAFLKENPGLEGMYGGEDSPMEVFYLKNATANFRSMTGRDETVKF